MKVSIKISLKEALKKLKLIKKDQPTNAAILMFGENPQEKVLGRVRIMIYR